MTSAGSSVGAASRSHLPAPTPAVVPPSQAARQIDGDKQVEILVRLGLSDDRSDELIDILNTAAWDVIDAVDGKRRSSHLLCELFNSAAQFLEQNAPDSLAQQAIKAIVGSALDNAGGLLASSPCRTIIVTSIAEFSTKLTDGLAVPDLAKVVMALRLFATLVCPNSCRDSEEASRQLGRIATGKALSDAHGG